MRLNAFLLSTSVLVLSMLLFAISAGQCEEPVSNYTPDWGKVETSFLKQDYNAAYGEIARGFSNRSKDFVRMLCWLRLLSSRLSKPHIEDMYSLFARETSLSDGMDDIYKLAINNMLQHLASALQKTNTKLNITGDVFPISRFWTIAPLQQISDNLRQLSQLKSNGYLQPYELESIYGNVYLSSYSQKSGEKVISTAGFAFDIEQETENLVFFIKTHSSVRVYLDNCPLTSVEDSEKLLALNTPNCSIDGAGVYRPFCHNWKITVPKLAKGRHTFLFATGFLQNSPNNYAVASSVELTPLPLEKNDLLGTSNPIELKPCTLFGDSEYEMVLNGFFSKNVAEIKENVKKAVSCKSCMVVAIPSLLPSIHVLPDVKIAAIDISKELLYPEIGDWLAAFAPKMSEQYDARLAVSGINTHQMWIRGEYSKLEKPEQKEKALALAIEKWGPKPSLLSEYCLLISAGSASLKQYLRWQSKELTQNYHYELLTAANSTISTSERSRILRILCDTKLPNMRNMQEIVRIELLNGNYRIALQFAERLCKRYPWIAHNWAILGDCQRKTGNLIDCIKSWETAVYIDPSIPLIVDLLRKYKNRPSATDFELPSDERIAALSKQLNEMTTSADLAILSKRYDLNLHLSGMLSGTIVTSYQVVNDSESIAIPITITEWSNYKFSRAQFFARKRIVGQGSEEIEISGSEILLQNVKPGTIIEIAASIDRETCSLFAPYSFDFVPVCLVGIPIVDFSYSLTYEGEKPKIWASEGMECGNAEGKLSFTMKKGMFIEGGKAQKILPSIAWSTLSLTNGLDVLNRDLSYRTSMYVYPENIDLKGLSSTQKFCKLFNYVRKDLIPCDVSAGRFFSPLTPREALKDGKATAYEFAFIFLKLLEGAEILRETKLFAVCDPDLYPWELPKNSNSLFLPMLISDFVFLHEKGGNTVLARANAPLPLSDKHSHFLNQNITYEIYPQTRFPELLKGFEISESASYILDLSAAKSGAIYSRASGTLKGRGAEKFEVLSRVAGLSRDQLVCNMFSKWLGEPRNLLRPDMARTNSIIDAHGSKVSFSCPAFEVDLSSVKKEDRAIKLIPSPIEVRGLMHKDRKVSPLWSGEIEIRITYDNPLYLKNEELQIDVSHDSFGKLTLRHTETEGRHLLYFYLKVEKFSVGETRIDEYDSFAQQIMKTVKAELRWKTN